MDNNFDSARSIARYAKANGHQFVVADDGPTAIEITKRTAPEVVLLVSGLLKMDGYAVATALHNQNLAP